MIGLSVCIPTYNRRKQLQHTLKVMLDRMVDANIDIAVFDNGSTDGTEDLLKEISKTNNIKYFRNSTNQGLDGNFAKIAEYKVRDYALWLGDDDVLLPEFWNNFDNIMRRIYECDADLVVLNCRMYNDESLLFRIDSDIIYNDIVEACDSLVDKLHWGILIVKNDIIKSVPSEYYNTHHIHEGIIWESLIAKYRKQHAVNVLVIKEPCVLFGNSEKTYKSYLRDTFYGMGRGWGLMPSELSEVIQRRTKEYIIFNVLGSYTGAFWRGYLKGLKERGISDIPAWPCSFEYYEEYTDLIDDFNDCKFVIFGAGDIGFECVYLFRNHPNMVKYIVDNDMQKHGRYLKQYKIYSPEVLCDENNVKIIIAMKENTQEVLKQLSMLNLKFSINDNCYLYQEFKLAMLRHVNL